MEDMMGSDSGLRQRFIVTVEWSPEAEGRLTEGDVREVIEQLVMDLDQDSVIEVAETVDTGD